MQNKITDLAEIQPPFLALPIFYSLFEMLVCWNWSIVTIQLRNNPRDTRNTQSTCNPYKGKQISAANFRLLTPQFQPKHLDLNTVSALTKHLLNTFKQLIFEIITIESRNKISKKTYIALKDLLHSGRGC